jgi:hypothetical protein
MPRRKNRQNELAKILNKKDKRFSLEDIPLKTMRVTIYALRWLFLLVFMFIITGILALFLTGGEKYVQQIIGYSITGFFTFFMGYFGWILAQGVIETVTGRETKSENSLSYYLKKNKKHKL